MNKVAIFALIALLSCVNAADYGIAKLLGYNNTIVGYVYFAPSPADASLIRVYANITGVTQNLGIAHGMHVHEFGDFLATDPLITGGHYKGATGTGAHACYPNSTRDAGDMGNWNVTAAGTVDEHHDLDLLTLTGDHSIIGRAVVFHLNTDDCETVSSSAGRLARGIIGVGNPAHFPQSIYDTVNVTLNAATNPGTATVTNKAVAYVYGTTGHENIWAVVTFVPEGDNLKVTAVAYNLPATTTGYGLHIHAFGDLSLTDGMSVGGHYDPTSQPHGLPPNASRHIGDFGSICTFVEGVGYYSYLNTLTDISGVYSIIGRGVVIHGLPDDGKTNYGPRWAQGVIGIANAATNAPTTPATVAAPNCGATPSNTTSTTGTTSSTTGTPAPTTTTTTSAPATTSSANIVIATSFVLSAIVALLAL